MKDQSDRSGPVSLEAEAAAWRSRRAGRTRSIAGDIPVVRIPKRKRPPLRTGLPDEGPTAAVSR